MSERYRSIGGLEVEAKGVELAWGRSTRRIQFADGAYRWLEDAAFERLFEPDVPSEQRCDGGMAPELDCDGWRFSKPCPGCPECQPKTERGHDSGCVLDLDHGGECRGTNEPHTHTDPVEHNPVGTMEMYEHICQQEQEAEERGIRPREKGLRRAHDLLEPNAGWGGSSDCGKCSAAAQAIRETFPEIAFFPESSPAKTLSEEARGVANVLQVWAVTGKDTAVYVGKAKCGELAARLLRAIDLQEEKP